MSQNYAFYCIRHKVFWKTEGLIQPSWQIMKHSLLEPNDKRVIIVIIILRKWTEYCSEPYTHESYGDIAFLDCNQPQDEDIQLFRREEVEIAIEAPKKEKSAGIDNIPAESVQVGG